MELGFNNLSFQMGRTRRKRHRRTAISKEQIKDKALIDHLREELGLKNNNLMPYAFHDTGRGLKTTSDIEANSILIRIPLEKLITISTIANSKIKFLFRLLKGYNFHSHCLFSLFLVYETHLGTKSKWYSYLKAMPMFFTNPAFCTKQEKQLLPKFILDNRLHMMLDEFIQLRKKMKILERIDKASCPCCNMSLTNIITYNRYKWAYYIVNTRAVYLDKQYQRSPQELTIKGPNNLALAPFLDFFNHSTKASVKASIYKDNDQKEFYQLKTLLPFTKGTQVFINYGPHNSLKLYIDYGFFIPQNPFDQVPFNISSIIKSSGIKITKSGSEYISTNNYHKNMGFTWQGLNYNANIILFVLTANLRKEDLKLKIYTDNYTSEDLIKIAELGLKVLKDKQREYLSYFNNMKQSKCHSASFSLAISLVEEYCNILNASLVRLETILFENQC